MTATVMEFQTTGSSGGLPHVHYVNIE